MSSVCRICLVGNTTLDSVKNKQLIIIYEKLTNAKLDSDDARPRALCCFCYQKLLRCYTFSQMAVRSEKIFSRLYDRDLKVTRDHITEVNLSVKHYMSVAIMPFIDIDGNATNAASQVTIKEEPLPSIYLKEEVNSEPDKLLEKESFPETFEEDYSDREKDTEELLSNTQTDQTNPDDSSFPIKDEPMPIINNDIKEKEATTLYKLVEVKSFPEYSTKSLITFEQACNNQETNVKELYKVHDEQKKPDGSKIFIKSKLISHKKNSHSHVEGNQYPSHKKHSVTTCVIEDKTIHHPEKKMACHYCNKTFYNKTSLICHLITHTGETEYACHVSDKKFTQKGNLNSHLRIHAGEGRKPTCHVCDKKFTQKSNLNMHMRIHSDKKPFACHICDRQFTQKGNLVTHLRIHASQKHPCLRRGRKLLPYD